MNNETIISRTAARTDFLKSLGAEKNELEDLLHHCSSRFDLDNLPDIPLSDEPFASIWLEYSNEAEKKEVFQVLREKLVQLRFPVFKGISTQDEYRAATLKGIIPVSNDNLYELNDPIGIKLFMHKTLAGSIPVLQIKNRDDFVYFVRALTMKNEPEPVPASMGAVIVSGMNNWDRINRYRKNWENSASKDADGCSWSEEFARLIKKKELYQDKLIIISEGGYSGISSIEAGIDRDEWERESVLIRLEHECTHYFTKRVFGSMKNALHDEFIADFAGIFSAKGRYDAHLFLLFMGLEKYPKYREGGRFQNYIGSPLPTERIIDLLKKILRQAAFNVEAYIDKTLPSDSRKQKVLIPVLASLHLDELASDEYVGLIESSFDKLT